VEYFPVGSLPVKSFPVKTLSTIDQNGKISAGKLSTDMVEHFDDEKFVIQDT
jgi:hypothetical protein